MAGMTPPWGAAILAIVSNIVNNNGGNATGGIESAAPTE
jgi:hypothetical protein